jgi:hypothetical protein
MLLAAVPSTEKKESLVHSKLFLGTFDLKSSGIHWGKK